MVKHLSTEEFNLIKNMANAASIEDRTKVRKGEYMYSSENGFYYLRSEFGEGSNDSKRGLHRDEKSEEERRAEYVEWYLENVPPVYP